MNRPEGTGEKWDASGQRPRAPEARGNLHVLLYQPPTPPSFWGLNHSLRDLMGGRRTLMPSLGLLTVAGAFPPAWKVRLIDGNLDELTDRALDACDILMMSAWNVQAAAVNAAAARARDRGRIVVAGGPGPTIRPEDFPNPHYLYQGELTIDSAAGLFAALESRSAPPAGQVYFHAQERGSLAQQPMPRFDLVSTRRYLHMPLQASAGCPFSCEFCEIPSLLGRPPRYKEPGRVIAELELLRAGGYRGHSFFVDDNFLGLPQRTAEILRAIIAWQARRGRPFTFSTEASITLADDETLMRMMREAGFTAVFIGLETTDEVSLREAGKSQNLRRDPAAAVQAIRAHGLEVWGAFIIGFDAEQEGAGRRIADFAERAGIVLLSPNLLGAPQGSPLRDRLAAAGRLLPETAGIDGITPSTNVMYLRGYDSVLADWRDLWRLAYDPGRLFPRIRRMLATTPTRPAGHLFGVWESLQILGRIVRHLGVRAAYRRRFWSLVWWAMRAGKFEQVLDQFVWAYHVLSLRDQILAAVQSPPDAASDLLPADAEPPANQEPRTAGENAKP